MQIKTITTAAGVNEIDFGNDGSQSTAHFYWLKNLGNSTLYVSANPNPIAEKDDVAELPAKGAVSVETDEGKIYILGAGEVEIHRTNSKFCPFELPSTGSGGGSSITIDSALSETSTNPAENRVITGAINDLSNRMLNPNLLINPDFKINQREFEGIQFPSDLKHIYYTVDRWAVQPGQGMIVNSDGTVTIYGGCIQKIEQDVGDNVTASVGVVSGSAVANYDPQTKTFSITTDGESAIISWAKLEIGSTATAFITPNPIDELIKCQRYYIRNNIARKPFGCGYAVNSSTANIFIPMHPLRSNITEDCIHFDNLALVGYGHTTNSESAIVTQVTNVATLYNGVSLQMVSSGLTQGHTYMPYLKDGGSIIFDAEIS